MGIPKLYKISKTQGLIFGSKLGVSILQHDERIKDIINKSSDVFGDVSEFTFRQLNTIQKYSYATPHMEHRITVPGLEWVMEYLRDTHDGLGLTIDQLYVESYLLGLCESTLIPMNIRHEIMLENNKFWDYISFRNLALK